MNKPYRAPVYQTYWECIQGLYRQGILGFYKGNGCRLFHIYFYGKIRNDLIYYTNRDQNIMTSRTSFFTEFVAATVASLFMHPIHFAESRMILNNRLPNFGAYKSLYTLVMASRDPHIVRRGASVHVPVNFIMAFTGFNYFSSINYYTYVMQMLSFHTLIYPLLTIQRRLECQSHNRAGMIPIRYIGPIHALGLTFREEGVRGLYRGYFAYLIATSIYTACVPLLTETWVMSQPICTGGDQTDLN